MPAVDTAVENFRCVDALLRLRGRDLLRHLKELRGVLVGVRCLTRLGLGTTIQYTIGIPHVNVCQRNCKR